MSDSLEGLQRQLAAAGDLKSVVRAMKALAASSLGQYEKSVLSLRDYSKTIELGLNACFRQAEVRDVVAQKSPGKAVLGIIIFGSDQGLVGQFNELIAEFFQAARPSAAEAQVWAVGQRLESCLKERGFGKVHGFETPRSIQAVAAWVGRMLVAVETFHEARGNVELWVFHHRPKVGATYEPVSQRLLPVDKGWSDALGKGKWPTKQLPQTLGPALASFQALLQEYIFVSLYRACAESLASENASRLAGMQRAEKNIDELAGDLTQRFHRLRQSSIDEELFDVVAGFESLSHPQRRR